MSLVCASRWMLAACLSVAGVACVSPATFTGADGGPDSGDQPGGGGGPGSGVSSGGGTGGKTTPSGNGGSTAIGAGGATGLGGRTGSGGTTTGVAGNSVIGPTANFSDNFENGNIEMHWLAPQSNTVLSGTSTPCGTWGVAADGATNHVYEQSSTACTGSTPTWAGGGAVIWTDMRLQVKVRFGAGATSSTLITIAVRYNTPDTMYYIQYSNDGKIKIRTREPGGGGDVATIASKLQVPVPAGQWVTIGLSVAGTTLNAYLGEDRTAPAVLTGTTNGTFASGGIALGVAGGTASFDDVLVTPP